MARMVKMISNEKSLFRLLKSTQQADFERERYSARSSILDDLLVLDCLYRRKPFKVVVSPT